MQASETDPVHWLVQTKFQAPPLRADVIARPRLVDGLRDALLSSRLSLICAPAGYGKSTLLANLPTAAPTLSFVWLKLHDEDDDPVAFLYLLVAALQHLHPEIGANALALLAGASGSSILASRIVGTLINDVLESGDSDVALVVDDLHLVTNPSSYAALDYLLERLPPQMRVVVATRQYPPLRLSRLRARGELAEFSLADLRFTRGETAALLTDQFQLAMSPAEVRVLHARTEGWPAGLRLVGISLSRIAEPEERRAFMDRLVQADRHAFDFLADEVLIHQEPEVRSFLLETSILAELTPALCKAVTGQPGAEAMLDLAERRNLFLIRQDAVGQTFRYHQMFAELLRERLAESMPDRVQELHRRAAAAETVPSRAIGHYLAAELWEAAADEIGRVGAGLVAQGLVDTVVRWIEALPERVRERYPSLEHLLGICAWQRVDLETARAALERALTGFTSVGDAAGQGQALADLAACALLLGDFDQTHALASAALALPLAGDARVQALMQLAWVALFSGDFEQAEAQCEAAEVIVRSTMAPASMRTLALYLTPMFAVLPDGVTRIELACRRAMPEIEGEISPVRVTIESHLAFVHCWRGRLDEAVATGERAVSIGDQLAGISQVEDAAAVVAVVHAARGHHDLARRFFDVVFAQTGQPRLLRITEPAYSFLFARSCWLAGQVDEVRETYAALCAVEDTTELPLVPPLRTLLRSMIQIEERRYADAERTLREAATLEVQSPFSLLFGSASVMLAQLYLAWNRPQKALAAFTPLLARCEDEDAPGVLLREGAAVVPLLGLAIDQGVRAPYCARLLALLGHPLASRVRAVTVPETGETLTPREVELLRLLASGAGNREIAERMVISQSTVKNHLQNIFRKLDVTSRLHAVARARDLGIA